MNLYTFYAHPRFAHFLYQTRQTWRWYFGRMFWGPTISRGWIPPDMP